MSAPESGHQTNNETVFPQPPYAHTKSNTKPSHRFAHDVARQTALRPLSLFCAWPTGCKRTGNVRSIRTHVSVRCSRERIARREVHDDDTGTAWQAGVSVWTTTTTVSERKIFNDDVPNGQPWPADGSAGAKDAVGKRERYGCGICARFRFGVLLPRRQDQ